jgi:hypothetical protein
VLAPDGELEALRMPTDRRDELAYQRLADLVALDATLLKLETKPDVGSVLRRGGSALPRTRRR